MGDPCDWYDAYRAEVENARAAKLRAWPRGCHSPSSCTRNRACMYTNCAHEGEDIRSDIDAALSHHREAQGGDRG